jgi:hypothetical protein
VEGQQPLKLRFISDGPFALEGAQSYDVFKSVTERVLARRGHEGTAADFPRGDHGRDQPGAPW